MPIGVLSSYVFSYYSFNAKAYELLIQEYNFLIFSSKLLIIIFPLTSNGIFKGFIL